MGGCSSHKRSPRSAPPLRHPNDEVWPRELSLRGGKNSLQIAFGMPSSSPELTSVHKGTEVHISPSTTPTEDKKPLSVSKSHLCHRWPNDEQKLESSINIDTEDLPTENKRELSATVNVDDNYTSPHTSPEERTPAGKIEPEGDTVNPQQPQNLGYEVANLPLRMVAQLRKLASTGNPESKAIAEELLEWMSKRPSSENKKQCPVGSLMSMSLDLNICVKESNVNIISEAAGEPDIQIWSSNSSYDSGDCGTVEAQSNHSKSSGDVFGNGVLASPPFFSGEDSMIRLSQVVDETEKKIEISHKEMIEISKRQFNRSRRKSNMMSEVLMQMPSLSQSLARSNNLGASLRKSRATRSRLHNGTFQDDQEDISLAMTSEIDKLDRKISESMVKITELRRKSLDLLTDGGDPGDKDENGENLSFIAVEKEINLLQEHKNKLVKEREQFVTELHSKLIDRFASAPLITPPTCRIDSQTFESPPQISVPVDDRDREHALERDSTRVLPVLGPEVLSDLMQSSSFSPVSNLSPRGMITEV